MIVTSHRLTNVRSIEAAQFHFKPGFNLVVGINGVGKTTVLETLGASLSAIVKRANGLRGKSGALTNADIRENTQALTIETNVMIGQTEYAYILHKSHLSGEAHAAMSGMPREQTLDTPDLAEFVGVAPKPSRKFTPGGRPFGVFFSTRRAISSLAAPSKGSIAGSISAAYADAFAHRELRLSEFAEWMRARYALKEELPEAGRVLEALGRATDSFLSGYQRIRFDDDSLRQLIIDQGITTTVSTDDLSDRERARLKDVNQWVEQWMSLNWNPDEHLTGRDLADARASAMMSVLNEALARLLPGFDNLRPSDSDDDAQLIDKKPITLLVSQLSDGERGVLALVLDLTRRLAQANPEMEDPAHQAEAIVLIDELDLHLHPRWQRQIIRKLTGAFPRCQFIATTHSPQVIGEIEHDRIQIIADGKVYSPTHSFGIDSSRVLEEVMDAASRDPDVSQIHAEVNQAIGEHNLDKAREGLRELAERLALGPNDPDVARLSTIIDFMDGEE